MSAANSHETVPFQVQWTLHTHMIVPNMPIHLDALLSWACVYEAELAGEKDPLSVQHDLPLQRHQTESGWCFMASSLKFEYHGDIEQLHYIRKGDVDLWARDFDRGLFGHCAPKLDFSSGPKKAYTFEIRQRLATRAVAYGLGDIERVAQLLRHVESIGKLRRRAKGRVLDFEVIPDERARDLWVHRNLPADSPNAMPGAHALTQQRLFAPYWSKERHAVMAPI